MKMTGKAEKTGWYDSKHLHVILMRRRILTSIQKAVDERQVDGHQQQNGFDSKHLEGSEEGPVEDTRHGPILPVMLRLDVGVLLGILLAKSPGLLCEEDGRAGLREEGDRGDGTGTGEDEHDPEHPAPAQVALDDAIEEW
jgi:hypothetical protein